MGACHGTDAKGGSKKRSRFGVGKKSRDERKKKRTDQQWAEPLQWEGTSSITVCASRTKIDSRHVTLCVLQSGGMTIEVAYVCKTGHEGGDGWVCQDSFGIYERLGGDANRHLFGVFDGHGPHGTDCAEYVRDHLLEHVLQDGAEMTQLELALPRLNEAMHASQVYRPSSMKSRDCPP